MQHAFPFKSGQRKWLRKIIGSLVYWRKKIKELEGEENKLYVHFPKKILRGNASSKLQI